MKTCDTCKYWMVDWNMDEDMKAKLGREILFHHACFCPKVCYVNANYVVQHTIPLAGGVVMVDQLSRPTVAYGSDVPQDALMYTDMNFGIATLSTGPKFGCIHHEEGESRAREMYREVCSE